MCLSCQFLFFFVFRGVALRLASSSFILLFIFASKERMALVNEERGKLGGMQFGSKFSGLFSAGGTDPREYVGPANPRRCATPQPLTKVAKAASRSPKRAVTPAAGQAQCHDGLLLGSSGGSRSIETFDPQQVYFEGEVVFDSPRTVEACLTLGILPKDLFARTPEDVRDEMVRLGDDVSDPNIVKQRYEWAEKKRFRDIEAIKAERNDSKIRSVRDSSKTSSPAKSYNSSAMIDQEERRLQKIIDTNTSRLRQQLLHRELLQRKRDKEDQRLAQQRRDDERKRHEDAIRQMEKSRKEEEAQLQRNEARECERAEEMEIVEQKRAQYEKKDAEMKERMEREHRLREAHNEAKRQMNAERRERIKETTEKEARQRRERFRARWKEFEASRQEHEERREVLRAHQRAEAARKQEKIEEAIARCQKQLERKIAKTQAREQAAEEQLRRFKEEWEETYEKRREEDAVRESQRKAVYEDAKLQHEEKVARLSNRIRHIQLHMQELGEKTESENRLRHETQRERELHKRDCVERSKRKEVDRVRRIEASILHKVQISEELKERQEELKLQRKEHRQKVEQTRVQVPTVTPGPGDYCLLDGNVGTAGPRWKFGLPASVMSLRVISRHHPAPGYHPAPGPCTYVPSEEFSAPKLRMPRPFFARHDRWNTSRDAEVTPGPAEYAPEILAFKKK